MADNRVSVILETIYKGEGGKQAEAAMKNLSKEMQLTANIAKQKYAAAQKEVADRQAAATHQANLNKEAIGALATGFGVAAGIIVGAGKAITGAFEFAQEGAELDYAMIKFDRLAKSIGTTGDALRNDLSGALNGMMSDMDGVALAADLIGLGLVTTHDQAVRLANVVSQLDMNMNQLTLTLSNKTTMRFDTLGVAVAGFDDKLAALEAQGYDTNAAFTEAFLQQAEEQIEKVGNKAETAAGQMAMVEAGFKNVKDTSKLLASQMFQTSGAGDTLVDMFGDLNVAVDTFRYLKPENVLRAIGEEGIITKNVIRNLGEQYFELKDAQEEVNATTYTAEELTYEYQQQLGMVYSALNGVTDATEENTEAWSRNAEALGNVISAYKEQLSAEQEHLQWVMSGGPQLQQQIENIFATYANGDKAIADSNALILEWATNLAATNNLSFDELLNWIGLLIDDEERAVILAQVAYDSLQKIDGMEVEAFLKVNVIGGIPKFLQGGGSSGGTTGSGLGPLPTVSTTIGAASGADFVVPPGFPNDSFPMFVQSGEHVQVTPAGKTGGTDMEMMAMFMGMMTEMKDEIVDAMVLSRSR